MRLTACALVLLSTLPLAAQQRPIVDASPTNDVHVDAKLSPDGLRIAYLRQGNLAVTDDSGTAETVLLSGTSISSFLWSPSSTTVYVVDGNRVLAQPRNGGQGTQIANVPGQSVRITDIDQSGALLYGTRFDSATSTTHVFSLDTTGGTPRTDLVASQDLLDQPKVDPSGNWLLYTKQSPVPFSPIFLMRARASDGGSPAPMHPGDLGTVVERPDWIDQGDTAVCATVVPGFGTQITRIDRVRQTIEPLTSFGTHRRPSVTPDGQWIICESVDTLGGNGPALLPSSGGGVVELYVRERYDYTGPPTIDAAATRVVFSASRFNQTENAKIWRLDMDDELLITPRAEIGSPVTLGLPLASNEIGGLFLGQRTSPFQVSGVNYDFDLGTTFAVLGWGPAQNGAFAVTVPLPNVSALQGVKIDVQGVRADPVSRTAEFTRFAGMTIF